MDQQPHFGPELHAAFDAAYDLQRELVGGGMSRVFLATERALNRQVVIKVLPPELAAGVNRERFRREIQLAAQLQHPHIVPLYAAGEHGDLLYYTMPFIEGESLRHALQGSAPTRFNMKEIARILHDVVDALAYAHERGVIHRDIKPGNVLRSGSHAVVTDFGVAKAISAAMPAVGMTTSGMAIGTPAYMAPEQLAGDPAADHRVDIYAVGLLAYELLTGVAPFNAKSPQETLAAQLTRDPEPIDHKRPDVPAPLAQLVMKCLAKMPEKRPQTAIELLAELDALQLTSGNYFPAARPRSKGRVAAYVAIAAAITAGGVAAANRSSKSTAAKPAADTVVKIADAAPALLLTRAESLSIAEAVEKKLLEQQTAKHAADSAKLASSPAKPAQQFVTPEQLQRVVDSMRIDVQRAVTDSFVRMQSSQANGRGARGGNERGDPRYYDPRAARSAEAIAAGMDALKYVPDQFRGVPQNMREAFSERAAAMGPPRRVFVSIPAANRRNPAIEAAANVVMDSLRRRLSAVRRFVVIDHDSVRATLAKTRTTDSLAKLLNVDLFASVYPAVNADSSVTWLLTVRDLTAGGQWSSRSVAVKASRDSLLAPLDSLTHSAMRSMEEMDHAPRRKITTTFVAPAPPAIPPAQPTPIGITINAPIKKP